jgi:peptidoglycan/xylan/chitin deacetylase (PgdA/CDA1 family)
VRGAAFVLIVAGLLSVAALGATVGVVRGEEPSPQPSPSPTTPPPVTTVAGADDLWHADPVRLVFVAQDMSGTGIAATEFAVDGGAWRTGNELIVPAPRDHSWDGEHTVSYRSRDNAGVIEPDRTCVVRIDTTAPRSRWLSCTPAIRYRTGPQRLRVRVDDVTGLSTVKLRVLDVLGRTVALSGPYELKNGAHALIWNGRSRSGKAVAPGTYAVQLELEDVVGNSRVSAQRRFRDQHAVSSAVVRNNTSAGRRVALTFDDGGDAGAWSGILSILRSYKLKGSFFPVGSVVAGHPELARRTVAEGHDVGNHSWNHPTMSRLGFGETVQQLRWTEGAWWRAARVTTAPFFRPPYGDYSSTTVAGAGAAGYRYTVLWDVDPFDWAQPGAGVIVARVLGTVRPGSIILLHCTGQTVQALPSIIQGLKARGLHPVTLHELFAAGLR